MMRILVFGAVIFCCSLSAFSQPGEFIISAKRAEMAPTIDGRLDEAVWDSAPAVSDFIQFVPNNGDPASLKTVAKVLYDDDDQTSYYFRTNIQGVQHDGRMSDNGRAPDDKWDGIWMSVGARMENGGSVEMAIPLPTLKYPPGKNKTWGIQFFRYIPRNREQSFWTGPMENYRKVSNSGAVTGLDLLGSGGRLELIPHVVTRVQENEKRDLEAGLDARYDFSQTVSGHLTANPDFATVEADTVAIADGIIAVYR